VYGHIYDCFDVKMSLSFLVPFHQQSKTCFPQAVPPFSGNGKLQQLNLQSFRPSKDCSFYYMWPCRFRVEQAKKKYFLCKNFFCKNVRYYFEYHRLVVKRGGFKKKSFLLGIVYAMVKYKILNFVLAMALKIFKIICTQSGSSNAIAPEW